MNTKLHNTKKNTTLKNYLKAKLQMLQDFDIQLNDEQMDHFNKLKTEIAIDNFYISIINKSIKTHI